MKPNDKALDEALSVTRLPKETVRDYWRRVLTAAYAAQFPPSEDYAGLVERLKNLACELASVNDTVGEKFVEINEAADALEAVLAERAAWKGRQEATAALLKQVETERDALAARLAPEAMLEGARAAIEAMRPIIEAADKEDSFTLESNARLAPVEAIESDKDDPTREYIPLPGGWEIQTKGRGSSHRLLDKKTGQRHMILAGDALFVQEFVMRMAKEINASAQVRPVAPVEDYNLEIMAAKEFIEATTDMPPRTTYTISKRSLSGARAAIAAVRPHIEAAEREKIKPLRLELINQWQTNHWEHCGNGLDQNLSCSRGEECHWPLPKCLSDITPEEVIAAIRSGK